MRAMRRSRPAPSPTRRQVMAALAAQASPARASAALRFFRTGPGEYGEGDRFIGVTVPAQRQVARAHAELPLPEALALLGSPVHEHRLTALLILIRRFERAEPAVQSRIYRALLSASARRRINNWDLVDTVAPRIFGVYLASHPAEQIRFERLLRSRNLWDRRIAILTTFALVRAGRPALLLAFAERCLDDTHDLIHKAVGWMLRETGKRDAAALAGFLDAHAARMPRTMLRYAIERLPPVTRRRYLSAAPASATRKVVDFT